MDRVHFWQNFDLGTELQASGAFIYNGLRCLHDMRTLHFEEEIFEVLYNLSVGIERLLKVAVVLVEHDGSVDQEQFEKGLITHNHLDLLARIKRKHPMKLGTQHNEFLQMLGTFYKTYRYDRYSLHTVAAQSKEKVALLGYLEKHLKVDLSEDEFTTVKNEARIRRFIGRLVGKISEQLYDVICTAASAKNLYTYEIRYNSKAGKVFLSKEYTFENEDIFWKEVVIYLVNNSEDTGVLGFIRELDPLELDPALVPEYLQCLASDTKKLEHMEEVAEHHLNLPDRKERLEALKLLGEASTHIDWDGEMCPEDDKE